MTDKIVIESNDCPELYIALCMNKYYKSHFFFDTISKIEYKQYYEDDYEIYEDDFKPDLILTIKPRSELSKECNDLIEHCIDYLIFKRKTEFPQGEYPQDIETYINEYLSMHYDIDKTNLIFYDISTLICEVLCHYGIGEYGSSMRRMWLDHELFKNRILEKDEEHKILSWTYSLQLIDLCLDNPYHNKFVKNNIPRIKELLETPGINYNCVHWNKQTALELVRTKHPDIHNMIKNYIVKDLRGIIKVSEDTLNCIVDYL